jgi:hypothetical protein
MIPKIIFQTYSCEYEDLPSYIKNCTETWKEKNPEFEYVYMSEKECHNFILSNYGERHAAIYSGLKHKAMKGDWWRYLIVNKLGGIYMDIDTVCRKPLIDEIDFSKDFVTTLDLEPSALFTQWGFGSSKDSPILNNLIDYILNNYDGYPLNRKVLKTDLTGPVAFQKSIHDILGQPVSDLIKLSKGRTESDVDFAQDNRITIEEQIKIFNKSSEALKNNFKLYFWTFNNSARHFTAAWRWSDNTLQKNVITEMLNHNCENMNYEYADIKIKLKNKSYSSFIGDK